VVTQITRRLEPTLKQLGASQIFVGAGSRHRLPALLGNGARLVVSDDTVRPLWAAAIAQSLDASLITISAGERYKTLDTVRELYDEFLQHKLDRSGTLVAIGGGVVGDVTGFAAASFMRGVRWVNVPATLLAMVDASLSGKTGVDLPQGKNLVGAFHPPAVVVIDPVMLETLPHAELVAGMGKVLKHGIIADPYLFAHAHPERLTHQIIEQAMQVKIDVVTRDPYERGERVTLNLGHTIGHGIESASDYALRHGESIAIGLVGEAMLAERLGIALFGLADDITARLENVGLPVRYHDLDPDLIRERMQSDKKKQGGTLRFVLPTRIGAVEYGVVVPDDIIDETLVALQA